MLELRIHGAHHVQPHELLDLEPGEVRQSAGDVLGSFWEPTPSALADHAALAETPRERRGHVPPGLRREVYYWGGMVRTSPPESGLGGRILAAIARSGWALLLPFSIANAAMWTWELPPVVDRARRSVRAGIVRLFGVVLTLLFVTTFAIVALDIVARQCFPSDEERACAVLPEAIGVLGSVPIGVRLAICSLVPIAVAVGLAFLSWRSQRRFEVGETFAAAPPHADLEPTLLTTSAFWRGSAATTSLRRLHLAAAVSLVAVLLAANWEGGTAGIVVGTAAALVLVGSLGLIAVTRSMPSELGRADGARPARLPAVLVWLACLVWATIAVVGAVAGGLVESPPEPWVAALGIGGVALAAVAVAGLVAIGAMACFPIAGTRSHRGWRGFGPAVFATAALGLGLVWSSLIAVGVGDWLNAGAPASSLSPNEDDHGAGGPDLDLPVLFPVFMATSTAVAMLAGVVALALAGLRLARLRLAVRRAAGPALAEPFRRERRLDRRLSNWTPSVRGKLGRHVGAARVRAARLQKPELVAGFIAAVFAVAIAIAIALATTFTVDPEFGFGLSRSLRRGGVDLIGLSLTALSLAALAALAWLAIVGDRPGAAPAILGDLVGVVPRRGHPFGSPGYLERAAPEVAKRVDAWFAAAPGGAKPDRRVVLAGHGIGAVVAIGALAVLSRSPESANRSEQIALLTFGTPLRPWFGRIFPELFGAELLGTVPCRSPNLWSDDPWARDSARPGAEPRNRRIPFDRWINLWRATDPIGMPAYSTARGDNPVDRYAGEIDDSDYLAAVAVGGHYLRQPEFTAALLDLAGLEIPGPPGDEGATAVRRFDEPGAGRQPQRGGRHD